MDPPSSFLLIANKVAQISISQADIKINVQGKKAIYDWIKTVILSEKKQPGEISIVLCSDRFLLDMNKQFLDHDYFTDIITFDYTEGKRVSGELYISAERVKDNAEKFKSGFHNELHRVIIHGVLHLCGYKDKVDSDQKKMRRKEDQKLQMLNS
jgi:probable rRNA maturation factor